VGADMTMTLSTLTDFIRAAYNSATGDTFFTDQWMIKQIWAAETMLANDGWVIEKTYTTTSVIGTRSLAWPSNCIGIKEVRYKGTKLIKVDLENDPKNDDNNPTGTPTTYAIWEKELILFPTPTVAGDTIQLRTYQAPSELSAATDPLNVPDEYQICIADKVLAEMAIKDQNLALATAYNTKWMLCVEKARQNQNRQKRADKQARTKDYYFGSDPVSNRFPYNW
jgi:hypothetical protein